MPILYAVNRSALDRRVNFLEQVMRRPDGHLERGPQHYGGALTMFRPVQKSSYVVRHPSIAGQRCSRDDIHGRWLDRVPGLRTTANSVHRIMR